jgi:hypothetical protein
MEELSMQMRHGERKGITAVFLNLPRKHQG